MKHHHSVCMALLLSMALTAFAQMPASGPASTVLLAPTGLSAGPVQETLIQGAIAYLQINSIEQLAYDLDELLMSAFPEEIAPPPLQGLLAEPHPLLTFAGQQTVQAPLDAALLSAMTGIDITRPLTATLYLAPGGPSFVVTVPVADYRTFTAMLMNVTMAQSIEITSLQGSSCYDVQPTKPNLPAHLYVLCSTDRAYICTSASTAAQLGAATPARSSRALAFACSAALSAAAFSSAETA